MIPVYQRRRRGTDYDGHFELPRGIFEAIGFVCSESENGEQALAEAGGLKPDLILLDYPIPIMNGLEAAPLIKKILPQTPIIMVTMFANEVFGAEALALGGGRLYDLPSTKQEIPYRRAAALTRLTGCPLACDWRRAS